MDDLTSQIGTKEILNKLDALTLRDTDQQISTLSQVSEIVEKTPGMQISLGM